MSNHTDMIKFIGGPAHNKRLQVALDFKGDPPPEIELVVNAESPPTWSSDRHLTEMVPVETVTYRRGGRINSISWMYTFEGEDDDRFKV